MKPGKYSIKELFSNRNIEQIIIPEIQRDYVWEKYNVDAFLNTINDDALENSENRIGHQRDMLNDMSPEMREEFGRFLEKNKKRSNIGFIYAYYDAAYADKYFLIDGQQRLTTVYLLLLALSVKQHQSDDFEKTYFNNEMLRLDYKVREASHDFMQNFVSYILKGGQIEKIKDKYWYHAEYENDRTIQSIISNFKNISDFAENCQIDLDYIEECVDFWFFDTNQSKQGEELYIYMNSRGETIQDNENIKAMLLEKLSKSESDKLYWGRKWEDWQNFFWKNKATNKNADNGFNEFLRWIIIIEKIIVDTNKELQEQEVFLKELRESRRLRSYWLELLKPDLIEGYFNSLKKIFEDFTIEHLKREKYLSGNMNRIDYIRLLPLLMYVKKHPDIDEQQSLRFARFFFNVTKFKKLKDSPNTSSIKAIKLTDSFLKHSYSDVIDLLTIENINEYENILTPEERFKLEFYKNPPQGISRKSLEGAFWAAEDFKLNEGEISFVLDCINSDVDHKDKFDLDQFIVYSECFENLFSDSDVLLSGKGDLLRRALLTKGDYALWDGTTSSLGGYRYTFVSQEKQWIELIKHKEKNKYVKELLKDFITKKAKQQIENDDILQQMIDQYLSDQTTPKSWMYNFVLKPKLLAYCLQKKFCWISEDEIYLLRKTRAMHRTRETTFKLISEML